MWPGLVYPVVGGAGCCCCGARVGQRCNCAKIGQLAQPWASWGTSFPPDAAVYQGTLQNTGQRIIYQGHAVYANQSNHPHDWQLVWHEIRESPQNNVQDETLGQRIALESFHTQSGGKAYAATWYWGRDAKWHHQHTLIAKGEWLAWGQK